jgi:hypothetical protein
MVTLVLGHFTDPVHVGQGVAEVLELEIPHQVVFVDDPPAFAELTVKRLERIASERGHSAAAGDAPLVSQLHMHGVYRVPRGIPPF